MKRGSLENIHMQSTAVGMINSAEADVQDNLPKIIDFNNIVTESLSAHDRTEAQLFQTKHSMPLRNIELVEQKSEKQRLTEKKN